MEAAGLKTVMRKNRRIINIKSSNSYIVVAIRFTIAITKFDHVSHATLDRAGYKGRMQSLAQATHVNAGQRCPLPRFPCLKQRVMRRQS